MEQPWPAEGTLNSEIINTIRMLVMTYKAEERQARRKRNMQKKEKPKMKCCNVERGLKGTEVVDSNKREEPKSQRRNCKKHKTH